MIRTITMSKVPDSQNYKMAKVHDVRVGVVEHNFSCVRLLLPLHHIMYTTGMLQLKIGKSTVKTQLYFY